MLEAVKQTEIYSDETLKRTIVRISHELIEHNRGASGVILAGVRTRGIYLAHRLARNIELFEGPPTELREIDAAPFRDDVQRVELKPPNSWSGENTIAERVVILVDDVIFTGRTVRSAIEALLVNGRPRNIQLAVLVDRGHRELPVKPNYVGFNIPTERTQSIKVNLEEVDGKDCIELVDFR